MSSATNLTISSLPRLTPTTLSSLLLSSPSQVAVIDVRDSDHIGGHIKFSAWVPMNELDAKIPELIRLHGDKDKVVFHCMLSQQRGPSAALKFARALRDKSEKEEKKKEKAGARDEEEPEEKERAGKISGGAKAPEVCILEGGFGMWQARYGEDERLTEGYLRDLWE